jgi:tRNA nucleotidyltransferase/poly(A) polymerase
LELDALFPPGTLPGRALDALRDQGVEVYLVGGSVRDALLGRPAVDLYDLDFAVPSGGLVLARRLADLLGGAFFALDAGRDTGRVVLSGPNERRLYLDVARWRGDSLQADLADRDFTINAMALDIAGPRETALIDPFRGRADLAARVVRAVTDRTFVNDPARLLRAVRMEAQLGFQIEPHTEALLRAAAPRLDQVSRERVRDELIRILRPPGAVDGVGRLDELGLLATVLPEIVPPGRAPHTLRALEGLYASLWPGAGYGSLTGDAAASDLLSLWREGLRAYLEQPTSGDRRRATLLRLAALFCGAGKAQEAGAALRRLRFSRREAQWVRGTATHSRRLQKLARTGPVPRLEIYRFFRHAGDAGVGALLLGLADGVAAGPTSHPPAWPSMGAAVSALLGGYFTRYREVVDPPRLVGGRDLMAALDLPPGPRIGRLLEGVREAQAAGRVSSREEALALAREMLGEVG